MFERFTDRARQTVVLAQEEARALGHDYIGTEHLLLGLLREAGRASPPWRCVVLGVGLAPPGPTVVELIGRGTVSPAGTSRSHPGPRRCSSCRCARRCRLGHNYIGTEHILLAVVREGEGVGAQVLGEGGRLRSGLVRATVLEQWSAAGAGRSGEPP